MTIGVYRITSITDGKFYIGSSTHLENRFNSHKYYLRRNKHQNKHLQAAWNKYSESNFIFEIIDTISEYIADKVFSLEQFYLDAVKDWTQTYNVVKDTKNPTLGMKYEGSKYYSWDKDKKLFIVAYRVNGIQLKFGKFEKEVDAQERVAYIKSLTKDELLVYSKECNKRTSSRRVNFKGYSFDKSKNRWRVAIWNGCKAVKFGNYKTEAEAIKRVEELKTKHPELFTLPV